MSLKIIFSSLLIFLISGEALAAEGDLESLKTRMDTLEAYIAMETDEKLIELQQEVEALKKKVESLENSGVAAVGTSSPKPIRTMEQLNEEIRVAVEGLDTGNREGLVNMFATTTSIRLKGTIAWKPLKKEVYYISRDFLKTYGFKEGDVKGPLLQITKEIAGKLLDGEISTIVFKHKRSYEVTDWGKVPHYHKLTESEVNKVRGYLEVAVGQ